MRTMDIAGRKINLISWISNLQDEKILSRIETVKGEEADWWETISDEERAEIEEGIAQLDRGESIPHEQVMAKYKKWL
jgi:hypothetical protein